MNTPASAVSMRLYNITPRPHQFHWLQLVLLVCHGATQWLVWAQIDAAGWVAYTGFLPWFALAFAVGTAVVIWLTHIDVWSVYLAVIVAGGVVLCWQLTPVVVADVSATLGPAVAARLAGYTDTINEVAMHFMRWWRLTLQGESAHDTVLFVSALACICLSITIGCTWLLFRLQLAWVSLICSGIPLLVNHTFVPQGDESALMVFVLLALLIVVVNHIAVREGVWQYMHIDHSGATAVVAVWQAIILLVPIVFLAFVLPLPTNNDQVYHLWQALRTPFTTVRTSWETVFGNGGVNVAGGFSATTVSVAGPRQRSEQSVLRVQTTYPDYLRVTSFDWYTGSGWQRRARVDTVDIPVGQRIANPNDGAIAVSSRITLTRPRNDNFLMSVGIPSAFGVDARITTLSGLDVDSNSMFAVQSDIIQNTDTTYTVTSLLSRANETELRAAPPAPAAINNVYLLLPDTVPARVTDLARTVVRQAGASTRYDQTMAIQSYLRTLTYDENRPRPPASMDWVAYFLFESQRGYCDDFATAMVVMLRTQAIPARLVQGYVLADRDPLRGDYVVRESLAHSWVEVYFDGFGWQRFEPTPTGYTRIPDRTDTTPAAPIAQATTTSVARDTRDMRPTPTLDLSQFEPNDTASPAPVATTTPWWVVVLCLAGAALSSGTVGTMWWRRLPAPQRLDLTYRLICIAMRRCGIPVSASTTANEVSQLAYMHLPNVADAVTAICHTYNAVHFAKLPPHDWPVMPWQLFVHTCAQYWWQQQWGAHDD